MENINTNDESTDQRLAQRLKTLRGDAGWSMDELAKRSGVSRATLSRMENAEVSPTASVLGKLCAAYGMPMSRLMRMVEDDFAPLMVRSQQAVWNDPDTGFRRRSVSPPARPLAGEVIECELPPATQISYDATPRPGLEHHVVLLDGRLDLTVNGQTYALQPGDCLRFLLFGPNAFSTPAESGAKYLVFLV